MKAAIKRLEGDFEIKEVETPRIPHASWALARVKASGICGTDLRHWKVKNDKLEGKIMGHELSAEVVEVGADVKHIAPADRVVVETLLGDGTCPWCRIQRYNVCPHLYDVRVKSVSRAFAEYVVGPAEKFHKLPENVSDEEATLLDTFSVSLHAIQLSGIRLNQKVAVLGAGPIGLGQMQLAKISGADVICVDVIEHSLQVAKELGADVVVNAKQEDVVARVKEFSDGLGVDIVYECAGGDAMPTTFPEATKMARIGGKVVLVGGFDEGETTIPLEWQRIQKGEIQIIPSASYSFWGTDPEMRICIDLVSKGKLNAKKLITHTFPLDQINRAFDTAENKEQNKSIFVGLIH